MWGGFSARAQAVIGASHSVQVRGTAYGSSIGTMGNLPISGGSVTVDATSQVRRSATVVIADPSLWPRNPTDALTPFGSELFVEYGVVIPGVGTEWVPLIRGVISEASRQRPYTASDGSVTLNLVDKSARVHEDRLDAPSQTVSGATTVVEIRRLIQETLPGVTVTDLTGSSQVASVLEIERERWRDGVEKLADSLGAEVYADQVGGFVIRYQPTLSNGSVWEIRSGDGGTLVTKSESLTRERVYNRVIASGQRTDGTAPVRAVVSDTATGSPTVYGGPFGRKPRFYSSPLLTTTGQCTTAATALLERAKGIQASVDLGMIVNPALDAGDVIRVYDEGIWQSHIIDKLTIPLKVGSPMTIGTRSVDLGSES